MAVRKQPYCLMGARFAYRNLHILHYSRPHVIGALAIGFGVTSHSEAASTSRRETEYVTRCSERTKKTLFVDL